MNTDPKHDTWPWSYWAQEQSILIDANPRSAQVAFVTTTPPGEPASATASIAQIEASLRCFVFSLLGLIPFVGLPFCVAAMLRTRKLQKQGLGGFNPADPYLKAASRIAPFGLLSTAAVLIVCVIVPAFTDGFSHSSGGG